MLKVLVFCMMFFTGAVLKAHPPELDIYSEVFELRGQRLTLLSHMRFFFEGALGDVPLKNEQDAVNALSGLLDVQLKEEEGETQELKALMPQVCALYEHKLSPQMKGLWCTQVEHLCRERAIDCLGGPFYETILFSWEFLDFQGVDAPEYVKDLSSIVRQFGKESILKTAFVRAILPHVKIEGQDDTVFLQNKPSVAYIRQKMKAFLEKEQTAVSKMVCESAWSESCIEHYLNVWERAQTVGDIDRFIMGGMIDVAAS